MRMLLVAALLGPLAGLAATQANAQLVAYYDFEDLDNAPGLTGPNATEAGTGGYTGVVGGIVGNAAEFTGTTDDVINTALGFGGGGTDQLGDSFTVSAWYNLDTDAVSPTTRFFVFEGDTDFDLSYGLRASLGGEPGNNDAQTFTNGLGSRAHVDAHTPGEWQHVLLTYDSDGSTTTITTYIDGIPSGAPLVGPTAALTSGGINIGNARNTALNRGFDGKIDEFAAWSESLTGGQIANVYELGLDGLGIPNVIPDRPAGDADNNGIVDEFDFFLISDNLTSTALPQTPVVIGSGGDVDFDGLVTFSDFRVWKDNASPAALVAAGFSIPEPTSFALVACGLGLLYGRRSSRR